MSNRFLTLIDGMPRLARAIAAFDAAMVNRVVATGADGKISLSLIDSRIAYDSIGSIAPVNPTDGFRWLEINPSGLIIGEWTWINSLNGWIDNSVYIAAASATNVAATTNYRFQLPIRNCSRILIDAIDLVVASPSSHSGTLFFSFTLQFLGSVATPVSIAGVPVLNTQSVVGGDPRTFTAQNINVALALGSGGMTGLGLNLTRNSTPGNINFDYKVITRRIR